MESIQHKIQGLSPQNDAQRWLKSTALQISHDIATARWLVLQQLSSSIQWPFLAILVFWLVTIFTSFGLFAPRNGTVIATLLVAALSVAGSIFLILEMDQPYGGYIKISGAPTRRSPPNCPASNANQAINDGVSIACRSGLKIPRRLPI